MHSKVAFHINDLAPIIYYRLFRETLGTLIIFWHATIAYCMYCWIVLKLSASRLRRRRVPDQVESPCISLIPSLPFTLLPFLLLFLLPSLLPSPPLLPFLLTGPFPPTFPRPPTQVI
ncbi:hypothetical protein NGA_0330900, partial [Nannochloropsis gaditana CCMP526]